MTFEPLPTDNREAIHAIHTQTVILAKGQGEIIESLRELTAEMRSERRRYEEKLERLSDHQRAKIDSLAERQRKIILIIAIATAVFGTALMGPLELFRLLLP